MLACKGPVPCLPADLGLEVDLRARRASVRTGKTTLIGVDVNPKVEIATLENKHNPSLYLCIKSMSEPQGRSGLNSVVYSWPQRLQYTEVLLRRLHSL